jgi:hypothetical protein
MFRLSNALAVAVQTDCSVTHEGTLSQFQVQVEEWNPARLLVACRIAFRIPQAVLMETGVFPLCTQFPCCLMANTASTASTAKASEPKTCLVMYVRGVCCHHGCRLAVFDLMQFFYLHPIKH